MSTLLFPVLFLLWLVRGLIRECIGLLSLVITFAVIVVFWAGSDAPEASFKGVLPDARELLLEWPWSLDMLRRFKNKDGH
jgi:hypothetical protein